ncbi:hypothetical protein [Marinoscillum luteum]|uniref:Uncharacterized protein n=1 Tax=Marinoscillum luteum TaxID=861051 RepID=A0ABW7N6W9_9BACT
MGIEFSAGTQENQKRLDGGCGAQRNGRTAKSAGREERTEACEPPASGARGLDRKAVRYELRGLAMCEVECRAFVI